MTILLGPCPCASCGTPVTVVRRPVVLYGHEANCGRGHPPCVVAESKELRETVALEGFVIHVCRQDRA